MTLAHLEKIDWDFVGSPTGYLTHNLHPYRAKFIPQIPAYLMQALTKEGDLVLDPFCGCGTTQIESQRLRRRSIGVDVNPLACLISKAKTSFIEPTYLLKNKKQFLENLKLKMKHHNLLYGEERVKWRIPDFPDRNSWFDSDALNELSILKEEINKEKDVRLRNFYNVCFSSILKTCSNQTEDFSYIADNMKPEKSRYVDVFKAFRSKVERAVYDLIEYARIYNQRNSPQILNMDTRTMSFKPESIDFVVTSPPYPNTTDYVKMFRLSFYWMNWSIDKWKKNEIGARWKRGRKSAIDDYFRDIKTSFKKIFDALRGEAYCCVVIGDSVRNKKRIQAVDGLVKTISRIKGVTFRKKLERTISGSGLSFQSVTKESILVFNKE